MNKTIVLTGGGTAGHVTPNLALVPGLREMGFHIVYIGGKGGMEQRLAEDAGLPYYGISTGKLRRYMSLKNLTDPFRVIKGVGEAVSLMRKLKPAVVFSKGGFVIVPVVAAARLCGIKSILHESDMTPGLANKLTIPFAHKVCSTFPETIAHLPAKKAVLTGAPIRGELFTGSKSNGRRFAGVTDDKPLLLVMGGSSGAAAINRALRAALPVLTKTYCVVHLCGRGHVDAACTMPGYTQLEFVSKEMPDLLAAADIVISRAGANSLCELLALHKPMLLIPLPLSQSRGDQIMNAESFRKQGFASVLNEEDMTADALVREADTLFARRTQATAAMQTASGQGGVSAVLAVIAETTGLPQTR